MLLAASNTSIHKSGLYDETECLEQARCGTSFHTSLQFVVEVYERIPRVQVMLRTLTYIQEGSEQARLWDAGGRLATAADRHLVGCEHRQSIFREPPEEANKCERNCMQYS